MIFGIIAISFICTVISCMMFISAENKRDFTRSSLALLGLMFSSLIHLTLIIIFGVTEYKRGAVDYMKGTISLKEVPPPVRESNYDIIYQGSKNE
jgi:uncharacterized membrane protein